MRSYLALVVLLIIGTSSVFAYIPDDHGYCPLINYYQPKIVWPTFSQYCTGSNFGIAELYDAIGNRSGCIAFASASHGAAMSSTEAELACDDAGYLHDSQLLYGICIHPCTGVAYPDISCAYCSTINAANYRRLPPDTPAPPTQALTEPATTDPNATPRETEPWENKKRQQGKRGVADPFERFQDQTLKRIQLALRNRTNTMEKRGKPTKPATSPPASTTPASTVPGTCPSSNPNWSFSYGLCEPTICFECDNPNLCSERFPSSCELRNWNGDVANEGNNYCGHVGFRRALTIEFTGYETTLQKVATYFDNYGHIAQTNTTASALRVINLMRAAYKRTQCNNPATAVNCSGCYGANPYL